MPCPVRIYVIMSLHSFFLISINWYDLLGKIMVCFSIVVVAVWNSVFIFFDWQPSLPIAGERGRENRFMPLLRLLVLCECSYNRIWTTTVNWTVPIISIPPTYLIIIQCTPGTFNGRPSLLFGVGVLVSFYLNLSLMKYQQFVIAKKNENKLIFF